MGKTYKIPKNRKVVKTVKINNGVLTAEVGDDGKMNTHSGIWKSWGVGDYGPGHNIGKNEEGIGRLFDANYSREPFTWVMQNFPRKWEVSPIGNARIIGNTLERITDD